MKIKCDTDKLLAAMEIMNSIAPTKSTRQVLKNVRGEVRDGQLFLTATDANIAGYVTVDIISGDDGASFLVSAVKLHGVVKEAQGDTVAISITKKALALTIDRDKFKITLDAGDFPDMPRIDPDITIEIEKATFGEMIRKVQFAAAKEKTRYALNGIHFSAVGGQLKCVGTDGRRLALYSKAITDNSTVDGVIIPSDSLQHIAKLIDGTTDDNLTISISADQFMVSSATTEITASLVDGHYPDYNGVIPKGAEHTMKINRQELSSGLKRAGIMANKGDNVTRFKFNGSLVLESNLPDAGESIVEIDAEYDGPEITIGFNGEYVADGMRAMESKTVDIKINHQNAAVVFEGDDNYLYMVMPVEVA